MTLQSAPVAPLLVFGWGNLSRGDDALGPLFVERLRTMAPAQVRVDFLEDYQLQIEHALDMTGRRHVLFVDASVDCSSPYQVTPLQPARDAGVTTHALSPQALLQVYCDLQDGTPPDCTLLSIRGVQFGLGEPPSPAALAHLHAALQWAAGWLATQHAQLADNHGLPPLFTS